MGQPGRPRWFTGIALTPMLIAFATAMALLLPSAQAVAAERLALVIGNSNYRHVSPLRNPGNDARLVAQSLEQTGFSVELVLDGTKAQIETALIRFGEGISRERGTVGLFYYAGHGVQIAGRNFILPVEVDATSSAQLYLQAVALDDITTQIEFADNDLNIIVLDACRNNPFPTAMRAMDRGLARMDAPTGTFIAYSTAPGATAADGNGGNSMFSEALAEAILHPGQTIEQTFKQVRRSVTRATGNAQVPWTSSSLVGDFYFANQRAAGTEGTKVATTTSSDTLFWQSIRETKDPELLRHFLSLYPDSVFAPIARKRALESQEILTVAPSDVQMESGWLSTPNAPTGSPPATAMAPTVVPAPVPAPAQEVGLQTCSGLSTGQFAGARYCVTITESEFFNVSDACETSRGRSTVHTAFLRKGTVLLASREEMPDNFSAAGYSLLFNESCYQLVGASARDHDLPKYLLIDQSVRNFAACEIGDGC